MPTISMFSTPKNYLLAIDSRTKLEAGLKEAQLAVTAGIPGAKNLVDSAQQALNQVNLFLATYFPNGAPE